MGMLDEAIREHLELKRRHGADAGEVAREQREALDPAAPEAPAGDGAAPDRPMPEDRAPDFAPEGSSAEPGLAVPAPDHRLAPEAPMDGQPETLGEETAELDMESVLDLDDSGHRDSAPVDPAYGDSHEHAASPAERLDEASWLEDEESSDPYRPLPGQERLSFE
jgi:hypothetical protein